MFRNFIIQDNFPSILAATPGCQNTTGCQGSICGLLFMCYGDFIGLVHNGFPRRLQELHWALLGFLRSVWFYMCRIVTTELPNLVPQRRIDDCCVIHFLHREFCDPQLSNHQNFPLWAGLYQHVFCKKPSLFSSSSRYRNLGLSESECRHYACPNPVPLLLATPLVIHEKNWKCLDVQAPGFPVALKDYVHRPNFL